MKNPKISPLDIATLDRIVGGCNVVAVSRPAEKASFLGNLDSSSFMRLAQDFGFGAEALDQLPVKDLGALTDLADQVDVKSLTDLTDAESLTEVADQLPVKNLPALTDIDFAGLSDRLDFSSLTEGVEESPAVDNLFDTSDLEAEVVAEDATQDATDSLSPTWCGTGIPGGAWDDDIDTEDQIEVTDEKSTTPEDEMMMAAQPADAILDAQLIAITAEQPVERQVRDHRPAPPQSVVNDHREMPSITDHRA
jgi:hypothetical protein